MARRMWLEENLEGKQDAIFKNVSKIWSDKQKIACTIINLPLIGDCAWQLVDIL